MSASDGQRDAAITALGIGDVDQLILRELGMDGQEVQGVGGLVWRRG